MNLNKKLSPGLPVDKKEYLHMYASIYGYIPNTLSNFYSIYEPTKIVSTPEGKITEATHFCRSY